MDTIKCTCGLICEIAYKVSNELNSDTRYVVTCPSCRHDYEFISSGAVFGFNWRVEKLQDVNRAHLIHAKKPADDLIRTLRRLRAPLSKDLSPTHSHADHA